MQIKIVHLTSVHPRYDTRIFLKECQSLANNGYDVSLVVADGKGDEIKNGVNICDVGKLSGRINRIFKTTKNVYQKALELDSYIYHLHDPELIPIGLKLLKKGKKVIFDAHEDLPKQTLSKDYLKPWQAKILAVILRSYERYALSKVSGVVSATPFICQKFKKINSNSIDINNYPILGELGDIKGAVDWKQKKKQVCYVGGITGIRGILQVIEALGLYDNVELKLVGEFTEQHIKEQAVKTKGWQHVYECGFLDRSAVKHVMRDSIAGIVTFLPAPNHIDAQPNKMFEYMSAGLPIITSNFPLWREIVEGNYCGICIDPEQPKEIAGAIEYLVEHPEKALKMGENGKKAVFEKYNWTIEERKLLAFYEEIM